MQANPDAFLTERENKILSLLADGCCDDAIAAQLAISLNTVQNHNKSIYRKLGVKNRTQAAAWLWRQRGGGRGVKKNSWNQLWTGANEGARM